MMGSSRIEDSRAFLSTLRPTASIAALTAAFRETNLGSGPVIGLHIRHGNGGRTGHSASWRSFDASIERCRRAVSLARKRVGRDAVVFLCTDSVAVEEAVRRVIQDVVCRTKTFRELGTGELHTWSQAHEGRDDAMVEMLLLAGCDALIRYPPGSFFTFYAAVMGRWKDRALDTLYDLQRPCDSADPLSPTVIF
jgi:hypothetical protein